MTIGTNVLAKGLVVGTYAKFPNGKLWARERQSPLKTEWDPERGRGCEQTENDKSEGRTSKYVHRFSVCIQ